MRHFRVIRIVYIKNPVIAYPYHPDQWVGVRCDLLSEVLCEPRNWADAYSMFQLYIWRARKQGIVMPSDMAMEFIVQGYNTRHGRPTNPFSQEALDNDRIIREREWLMMSHKNATRKQGVIK